MHVAHLCLHLSPSERLLHRPKQVAATYVLILTPTRELAVQIHSMVQKLAQYTDVQAALIVGGLSVQVSRNPIRLGGGLVPYFGKDLGELYVVSIFFFLKEV